MSQNLIQQNITKQIKSKTNQESNVFNYIYIIIDYDYKRDDRLKILYKNNARDINYFTKNFINC